jgi:uncharacterized protein
MNIREFAFNLQKVYAEMADTFSSYQSGTGLNCLASCGRCCLNPEVEASVLEMIPYALRIHEQGQLEEWLEKIETSKLDHCILFVPDETPGNGKCSSYLERPSVCRMFGVAGTFNKHHEVTHSICKYIKELNGTLPEPTETTPLIPEWSSQLSAIHPDLIQTKLPMNLAIKGALEKIAFYTQYQVI